MAKFDFRCDVCELLFEREFPFLKDKNEMPCPKCGVKCPKHYGTIRTVHVYKGGGFPTQDMKFNKDMTRRNEEAGRRMRKNKPPVRLEALDYGGGDVREVK